MSLPPPLPAGDDVDRATARAWLAFPVLLLPYLWLVRRFWFICDDAFITFRFSRNWARGHGPRYNLGDDLPVEGYSNFLWMAIAAVVEWVGADVTVVMPTLSVLSGVALLALTYRILLVHVGVSGVAAWASLLILATFPPFAVWSTSGLATMPQALLMATTWWLLALSRDRRAGWLGGISALLLALVRTEGVAWALVIGVVSAVHRRVQGRPLRPLLSAAAILAVGFGLFEAWRWSYYQALVSNTARAKVHLGPDTLLRGLKYVTLYGLTHVSPLLLPVAVVAGVLSRHRVLAASAGVLALAVPAYAVAVSGDYMAYFRLVVPGAAFLAVSVAIALDALAPRLPEPGRTVPALAGLIAVVGMLPAMEVHLVHRSIRRDFDVREKQEWFRSENEQWYAMDQHTLLWAEKGEALKAFAPPDATFVAAAIGSVGYASDLYIFDRNGLVNREVASLPWDGELRSPGHDRTVEPSFFLDRKPTIYDARLVYGAHAVPQVRMVLRDMGADAVADRYYPEIQSFGVDKRGHPRTLVWLLRASSPLASDEGWERFRRQLRALDPR